MNKKRNYIDEIVQYKNRLHNNKEHRFIIAFSRWMKVEQVSQYVLKNINSPMSIEMKRYLPIASVAFLQGYFRMLVRDIVNLGEPYVDRCDQIIEKRIKLCDIWEMNKTRTTLGELVAHLIELNNIDQINSTMSIILGNDFLNIVRVHNETEEDKKNEYYSGSYQRLTKTFELRNIYCHEFATKVKDLDKNDIADVVLTPVNFFWQTEMAMTHTIHSLVNQEKLLSRQP